ncbi:MAG: AAA family ATPase, partial [Gammaproteobacteria bacterium]
MFIDKSKVKTVLEALAEKITGEEIQSHGYLDILNGLLGLDRCIAYDVQKYFSHVQHLVGGLSIDKGAIIARYKNCIAVLGDKAKSTQGWYEIEFLYALSQTLFYHYLHVSEKTKTSSEKPQAEAKRLAFLIQELWTAVNAFRVRWGYEQVCLDEKFETIWCISDNAYKRDETPIASGTVLVEKIVSVYDETSQALQAPPNETRLKTFIQQLLRALSQQWDVLESNDEIIVPCGFSGTMSHVVYLGFRCVQSRGQEKQLHLCLYNLGVGVESYHEKHTVERSVTYDGVYYKPQTLACFEKAYFVDAQGYLKTETDLHRYLLDMIKSRYRCVSTESETLDVLSKLYNKTQQSAPFTFNLPIQPIDWLYLLAKQQANHCVLDSYFNRLFYSTLFAGFKDGVAAYNNLMKKFKLFTSEDNHAEINDALNRKDLRTIVLEPNMKASLGLVDYTDETVKNLIKVFQAFETKVKILETPFEVTKDFNMADFNNHFKALSKKKAKIITTVKIMDDQNKVLWSLCAVTYDKKRTIKEIKWFNPFTGYANKVEKQFLAALKPIKEAQCFKPQAYVSYGDSGAYMVEALYHWVVLGFDGDHQLGLTKLDELKALHKELIELLTIQSIVISEEEAGELLYRKLIIPSHSGYMVVGEKKKKELICTMTALPPSYRKCIEYHFKIRQQNQLLDAPPGGLSQQDWELDKDEWKECKTKFSARGMIKPNPNGGKTVESFIDDDLESCLKHADALPMSLLYRVLNAFDEKMVIQAAPNPKISSKDYLSQSEKANENLQLTIPEEPLDLNAVMREESNASSLGAGANYGSDDFISVSRSINFVDKTEMIKHLCEDNETRVNEKRPGEVDDSRMILITRPRRFGKSTLIQMLKVFFSKSIDGQPNPHPHRAIFEKLAIGQLHGGILNQHFGQHIVIFIDFKDIVISNDLKRVIDEFKKLLRNLAMPYEKILSQSTSLTDEEKVDFNTLLKRTGEEPDVRQGLITLTRLLTKHYKQKIMVLVDEYDAPLLDLNEEGDVFKFVAGFYQTSFKGNHAIERAILTGVSRIAQQSIFSSLNNLAVYTMMDDMRYRSYIGFTEAEVNSILANNNLILSDEAFNELRLNYGGYRVGAPEEAIEIYNPWDILGWLNGKNINIFKPYWVESAHPRLITKTVLSFGDGKNSDDKLNLRTQFIQLCRGEALLVGISPQLNFVELKLKSDAFWSLLYTTGYLTIQQSEDVLDSQTNLSTQKYRVTIPNNAVRKHLLDNVTNWFGDDESLLRRILPDLQSDNVVKNEMALCDCEKLFNKSNVTVISLCIDKLACDDSRVIQKALMLTKSADFKEEHYQGLLKILSKTNNFKVYEFCFNRLLDRVDRQILIDALLNNIRNVGDQFAEKNIENLSKLTTWDQPGFCEKIFDKFILVDKSDIFFKLIERNIDDSQAKSIILTVLKNTLTTSNQSDVLDICYEHINHFKLKSIELKEWLDGMIEKKANLINILKAFVAVTRTKKSEYNLEKYLINILLRQDNIKADIFINIFNDEYFKSLILSQNQKRRLLSYVLSNSDQDFRIRYHMLSLLIKFSLTNHEVILMAIKLLLEILEDHNKVPLEKSISNELHEYINNLTDFVVSNKMDSQAIVDLFSFHLTQLSNYPNEDIVYTLDSLNRLLNVFQLTNKIGMYEAILAEIVRWLELAKGVAFEAALKIPTRLKLLETLRFKNVLLMRLEQNDQDINLLIAGILNEIYTSVEDKERYIQDNINGYQLESSKLNDKIYRLHCLTMFDKSCSNKKILRFVEGTVFQANEIELREMAVEILKNNSEHKQNLKDFLEAKVEKEKEPNKYFEYYYYLSQISEESEKYLLSTLSVIREKNRIEWIDAWIKFVDRLKMINHPPIQNFIENNFKNEQLNYLIRKLIFLSSKKIQSYTEQHLRYFIVLLSDTNEMIRNESYKSIQENDLSENIWVIDKLIENLASKDKAIKIFTLRILDNPVYMDKANVTAALLSYQSDIVIGDDVQGVLKNHNKIGESSSRAYIQIEDIPSLKNINEPTRVQQNLRSFLHNIQTMFVDPLNKLSLENKITYQEVKNYTCGVVEKLNSFLYSFSQIERNRLVLEDFKKIHRNILFLFFSKLVHFSEFKQISCILEEDNQQLFNMFDRTSETYNETALNNNLQQLVYYINNSISPTFSSFMLPQQQRQCYLLYIADEDYVTNNMVYNLKIFYNHIFKQRGYEVKTINIFDKDALKKVCDSVNNPSLVIMLSYEISNEIKSQLDIPNLLHTLLWIQYYRVSDRQNEFWTLRFGTAAYDTIISPYLEKFKRLSFLDLTQNQKSTDQILEETLSKLFYESYISDLDPFLESKRIVISGGLHRGKTILVNTWCEKFSRKNLKQVFGEHFNETDFSGSIFKIDMSGVYYDSSEKNYEVVLKSAFAKNSAYANLPAHISILTRIQNDASNWQLQGKKVLFIFLNVIDYKMIEPFVDLLHEHTIIVTTCNQNTSDFPGFNWFHLPKLDDSQAQLLISSLMKNHTSWSLDAYSIPKIKTLFNSLDNVCSLILQSAQFLIKNGPTKNPIDFTDSDIMTIYRMENIDGHESKYESFLSAFQQLMKQIIHKYVNFDLDLIYSLIFYNHAWIDKVFLSSNLTTILLSYGLIQPVEKDSTFYSLPPWVNYGLKLMFETLEIKRQVKITEIALSNLLRIGEIVNISSILKIENQKMLLVCSDLVLHVLKFIEMVQKSQIAITFTSDGFSLLLNVAHIFYLKFSIENFSTVIKFIEIHFSEKLSDNQLAHYYYLQGKFSFFKAEYLNAKDYFNKCMKIKGNTIFKPWSDLAIIRLEITRNQFLDIPNAFKTFEDNYQIYMNERSILTASFYFVKGIYYYERNDYPLSNKCLHEAKKIQKDYLEKIDTSNNPNETIFSLQIEYRLALNLLETGQIIESIQLLNKLLQAAKDQKLIGFSLNVHFALIQSYYRDRRYYEARQLLKNVQADFSIFHSDYRFKYIEYLYLAGCLQVKNLIIDKPEAMFLNAYKELLRLAKEGLYNYTDDFNKPNVLKRLFGDDYIKVHHILLAKILVQMSLLNLDNKYNKEAYDCAIEAYSIYCLVYGYPDVSNNIPEHNSKLDFTTETIPFNMTSALKCIAKAM